MYGFALVTYGVILFLALSALWNTRVAKKTLELQQKMLFGDDPDFDDHVETALNLNQK